MELLVVNMRILRNKVTVDRIDMTSLNTVIRGDWLRKTTNIKYKNNCAAVYVGSSQTVHNPLFSVGKLIVMEEINGTCLLVNKIKMLRMLFNIDTVRTKTYNKGI